MSTAPVRILPARSPDDLAAIAALFRDYAASLDVDLAYQNFADELAKLPGKYQPPRGELLLVRGNDGAQLGCVALRPLEAVGCCEMKRLYVAPDGRGQGLGAALVAACISTAERLGYVEIRLDTLASMSGAQALYAKLGFAVTEPYYDTPIAGTLFMRRRLTP